MRRSLGLSAALPLLVLVGYGCLANPPANLPSSVRVIYSKATDDSLGKSEDIYFLVARSGNELRLTSEVGFDGSPEFSAGLRKVFYTRTVEGSRQIWSVGLDGSDEGVVLSAIGEEFSDPSVSPNETQLAYTRTHAGQSSIEIASVDGSNSRTLLEGDGPWRRPRWSPDGTSLAVVGVREGVTRIFIVDVRTGASQPLTPSETRPQSEPNWSPDGSRIVFKRGTGSAAEIALDDLSTKQVTRLTDNEVEDSTPSFSPRCDRIVFVSRRPHG
ncbi:MAG: hypothetical protein P8Y29_07965, partial [Gemmatimonadota bacterium]